MQDKAAEEAAPPPESGKKLIACLPGSFFNYPPPSLFSKRLVQPLNHLRCSDGDSVAFQCRFSSAVPISVRWAGQGPRPAKDFDSQVIQESDGVFLARLAIRKVYPEDEGEYICVATAAAGPESTATTTRACLVVHGE